MADRASPAQPAPCLWFFGICAAFARVWQPSNLHRLTGDGPAGYSVGMRVVLTPELDRFVQRAVASGRYVSSTEVVREGLRLLHEREGFRAYVEQAIESAEADVRAGRLVTPAEARTRLGRHHEQVRRTLSR
jgi:antitoxin ParD1/3/4